MSNPPNPSLAGASGTATSTAGNATATTTPWQLPHGSSQYFPSDGEQRLTNEENYLAWSVQMLRALRVFQLEKIVTGKEQKPTSDPDLQEWLKKDAAALALITKCITAELVIKTMVHETSHEAWAALAEEFSQTGSGSVMLWFRRLVRPFAAGGDISQHVNGFTEAIRYLAKADFEIPQPIAAAILLSTLPSDPKDPESWNAFVGGYKIEKTKTTLTSVVNAILEEKRRLSEETVSQETALAVRERNARANGRSWCRNCSTDTHDYKDCRSPGGPKYKKGGKKGKKKAKEKANVAQDSGGDEQSNHVAFEQSHSTIVEFSAYTPREIDSSDSSPTTPDLSEAAHSAHVASSATLIDSGTTSHIYSDRTAFTLYAPSTGNVLGFGQGSSRIVGRGTARLEAQLPTGGTAGLNLNDTCHVPGSSSLISVSRFDDAGCYSLFCNGRCVTFQVKDDYQLLHNALLKGQVVFTGTRGADRLYYLDVPQRSTESSYAASTTSPSKLEILHQRLGHLNYHAIRGMVRKGVVGGVKLSEKELAFEPPMCAACAQGKITRASFPLSETRANRFLGLVHSDLWGPAPVNSLAGHRYVMTITDDQTRWVWIFLLKRKSEAYQSFIEWKALVENESSLKLGTLRSDNGGEYLSTAWINFLKQHGIRHETTTPRTPEQNGVSERLNRTIFDRVRTILIDSGLPLYLWAEAANYIVYTRNRNSTSALKNWTPYQQRYGNPPDISRLHRFGCTAYVLNDTPGRSKLDPKGISGVFVGYADTQKAWRVYLPGKRTVTVSVHVRFDDKVDSRASFRAEGEIQFRYRSLSSSNRDKDDDDIPPATPAPAEATPVPEAPPTPITPATLPTPPVSKADSQPKPRRPRQKPPAPPPRPPSERIRQKREGPSAPTSTIEASDAAGDAATTSQSQAGDTQDSTEPADEVTMIASGDEPRNFREAMRSPDKRFWLDAMDTEMNSITALGTFKLVEAPPNANIIDTTWAYRIKRHHTGEIYQYKARLCARGFTQVAGVDFFETFAPVAKIESIRLLLAMAAALDWEIHVIDVNSAFLNSEMPEDQHIYLRQPAGYVAEGKEDLVWLLLKALYGLKQSGRLWYKKLKKILIELGFKVCKSDPCIFIRHTELGISIICSHVDDLGLFCSSCIEVDFLKSSIAARVPIKDGGEMSEILGIGITRDRAARTISLSHRRYIDTIVKTYGLQDANPVTTPLASGAVLSKDQCPSTAEDIQAMRRIPYQNAVGALNHAAVMTRPDIAFAVHKVAQFNANPGMVHWTAVKRIIRYLKGTRDHVLTLGGKLDPSLTITAYSDSDHAASPDHGRSVSGYVMMLGPGCFSWSAKKQSAVANSTAQAEYNAATEAGREIIWLRGLRSEIEFPLTSPTPFRIDNTSAISIIENPEVVSKRNKHFRLASYWLREECEARTFEIDHVPSAENVADIFTKALSADQHWKLAGMLGISSRADAR